MTNNLKVGDYSRFSEIFARVKSVKGAHAKVGFIGAEGAGAHGGTNNASIAAFNEFGTAFIEARPFMEQALEQRRDELKRLQAKLVLGIQKGTMSVAQAMGLLGAWGAGAIKATITQTGNFAANSPATIARKGSSRPLVDTGQMLNSVSWVAVA